MKPKHACVLFIYLAAGSSLFSCTLHHFKFGIVGQVGKPPRQREVNGSPLKPVES